MATVFLATQESFERKVALKVIADSAFGNKLLAEHFIEEAKIVGSFSHPHIVPVYDVGRVEQFHYLAMDYLQGGDLSSWIKSGLEQDEAKDIIIQVAKALQFAHNKGYIHRDIKPDNILFREDNSAVLTDFGIAQPLAHDTRPNQQMLDKIVVGTPAYMSPEQSQGRPIDARTDLYALGVMFYQMLTRQLPYSADSSRDMLIKHIREPVPTLPVPLKRYQPLINRLLAKQPEQRFKSALEFIKALENLAQHPDMTDIAASIADLKLVEPEETAAGSEKDFIVEQSSFRRFGLFKRYALHCQIRSTEPQHFALLFSQFTTRLQAWYDQHRSRCGSLNLCVMVDPLMASYCREKLEEWQKDRTHYPFLKSLRLSTLLCDLNGKAL